MDTGILLSLLKESLFLIVLFTGLLIFAMSFGRQTITNFIFGLYFAFLISLQFPYYEAVGVGADGDETRGLLFIGAFLVFLIISTILFIRVMPREYDEKAFEGFWKKILLAGAATALITAFSYHALPVTDFIAPGSPVQYLFGSEKSFFWWLVAPIIILFIV
jgi:hypothetical protein